MTEIEKLDARITAIHLATLRTIIEDYNLTVVEIIEKHEGIVAAALDSTCTKAEGAILAGGAAALALLKEEFQ